MNRSNDDPDIKTMTSNDNPPECDDQLRVIPNERGDAGDDCQPLHDVAIDQSNALNVLMAVLPPMQGSLIDFSDS